MQVASKEKKPAHYIFVAASLGHEPYTPGREIVQKLLTHGIWLAAPKTPFQSVLGKGDKALFYVGGNSARYFLGQAEIAGPLAEIELADEAVIKPLGLHQFNKRIPLRGTDLWSEALPLRPLVEYLNFVKNKKHYGLNLIKSVVRLSEEDYQFIVNQTKNTK